MVINPLEKQAPTMNYTGGNVKVADSTIFKAAKAIAVAEVTVEPGAMRYGYYTIYVLRIITDSHPQGASRKS